MTAEERTVLRELVSEAKRAAIFNADKHVRCLACGEPFGDDGPLRPNRLYCDKACRNAVDRIRRPRGQAKRICKHGHVVAGDNVYLDSYGFRRCRECRNAVKRRYSRQRAKRALALRPGLGGLSASPSSGGTRRGHKPLKEAA